MSSKPTVQSGSPIATLESPAANAPWYRELNRDQWRVLKAAFLGWIFDGYEAYALLLVMVPALRQLLPATELPNLASYAGILVAITLLGWAVGGVLAGIAADYFGRKRTMMITILMYAVFSGLTGFAESWMQLAAFRFLTGLGLGGEWATGATLIAESWPRRARSKGQGIMQSAFGWGSLLAAGIWYFVQPVGGESAWRIVFFFGCIPALFVFYIWRHVHESEPWLEKQKERRELQSQRRSGRQLSREEAVIANFTLTAVFGNPALRRLVLLCLVMSISTIIGYWAVATWVPSYVESVARAGGSGNPARWGAIAGLAYNVGAIIGFLAGGFLADLIGRRALLAGFFTGGLLTIPVLYLWARSPEAIVIAAALNGVFTSGQFVWMAIYPPELFPTAVRATAVSLIFNSARFISFLGPLFAGVLITRLGGYSMTAVIFGLIYIPALLVVPFLPETRGKPLPS